MLGLGQPRGSVLSPMSHLPHFFQPSTPSSCDESSCPSQLPLGLPIALRGGMLPRAPQAQLGRRIGAGGCWGSHLSARRKGLPRGRGLGRREESLVQGREVLVPPSGLRSSSAQHLSALLCSGANPTPR